MEHSLARSIHRVAIGVIIAALAPLLIAATWGTEPRPRFSRVYATRRPAHLTILNVHGNITVSSWKRRELSVRAAGSSFSPILERVDGDAILLAVRRFPYPGHVDFEVSAPPETSVSLKGMRGDVRVSGLSGHVSIDTVDGDIHLASVQSPSVDVRVISGDIFLDGEVSGTGAYNLQTMHGDIEVSLPESVPFNLSARALTERISLGGFPLSLTNQQPKFISGMHERGGPRLVLTAYGGRITLHKK
jgi:hypothetical protein